MGKSYRKDSPNQKWRKKWMEKKASKKKHSNLKKFHNAPNYEEDEKFFL